MEKLSSVVLGRVNRYICLVIHYHNFSQQFLLQQRDAFFEGHFLGAGLFWGPPLCPGINPQLLNFKFFQIFLVQLQLPSSLLDHWWRVGFKVAFYDCRLCLCHYFWKATTMHLNFTSAEFLGFLHSTVNGVAFETLLLEKLPCFLFVPLKHVCVLLGHWFGELCTFPSF